MSQIHIELLHEYFPEENSAKRWVDIIYLIDSLERDIEVQNVFKLFIEEPVLEEEPQLPLGDTEGDMSRGTIKVDSQRSSLIEHISTRKTQMDKKVTDLSHLQSISELQEAEKSVNLDEGNPELSVTHQDAIHAEVEKPKMSKMKTLMKAGLNSSLANLQNLS